MIKNSFILLLFLFLCSMAQHNDLTLNLLSWNIDGLDEDDLEERTEAVLATILSKKPDVVLLQEVVEYSLNVFQSKCDG